MKFKMNLTKENRAIIVSLILLALAIFFYVSENQKKIEMLKQQELGKQQVLSEIKSKIDGLGFLANAVSVYDIENQKEIYGRNSKIKMPLASLVKTMTVITAFENNSEDLIKIKETYLKEEGDSGLVIDEIWNIEDLAKFTLILSSNDGALALTREDPYFLKKMNEKAREIGMSNTTFSNVTGLDIFNNKAGVYGTAFDANIMAIYALKKYPNIFEATIWPDLRLKSETGYTHDIKNTNQIIKQIPQIMFSKTGFTLLAGGNLTVIFKNAYTHEIAVTILGSSMTGRFTDMEKIVNFLYTYNYEI